MERKEHVIHEDGDVLTPLNLGGNRWVLRHRRGTLHNYRIQMYEDGLVISHKDQLILPFMDKKLIYQVIDEGKKGWLIWN